MGLKTLKDLLKPSGIKKLKNAEEIIFNSARQELRIEAIKWINHYRNLEQPVVGRKYLLTTKIQWIMCFFNIEESDL